MTVELPIMTILEEYDLEDMILEEYLMNIFRSLTIQNDNVYFKLQNKEFFLIYIINSVILF